MWRRLDEQMRRGVIRNARVPLIPIRAPDGPEYDEARDFVLDQAVTDQDLIKLTYTATKYDKTAWLEAVIRRDESLGRPEKAARAYTLLGFTNQSPAFDAVWSDFDERPPTMGWLNRRLSDSAICVSAEHLGASLV